MAKYGEKAQKKVEKNLREMKKGKLKSSSGQKVTKKDQAIAIALDQTRRAGGKAPKKKTSKNNLNQTGQPKG